MASAMNAVDERLSSPFDHEIIMLGRNPELSAASFLKRHEYFHHGALNWYTSSEPSSHPALNLNSR